MSEWIVPLASAAETDLARVGGKARSLGRLIRAGLPVPDGFVVTCDAYRDHVTATGLAGPIASALAGIDSDAARLAERSRAIGDAFSSSAPAPAMLGAIEAALAALGGGPVAVRSSASAEDSATASFAGQHDTFLDLRGTDAVLSAILRCWASLHSERAIRYRTARDEAAEAPAIACVVQRMVAAEAAGVAFTADPLTGERDRIVLSAVRGLGESLVSGRSNADEYVIEKDGGRVLHRRCAEAEPSLPEAEALPALVSLALLVERHFAAPQDVEWAWAGGRAFLLQSRPITNLKPEPVPIAQAERPILGYLDRWREMFPSAGTPLLNDIAVNVVVGKVAQNAAFHGLLPASLLASTKQLGRIVRGRLYLDLDWFKDAVAPGVSELALVELMEAGRLPPLRALRPGVALAMLVHGPRLAWKTIGALLRLDVLAREAVEQLDRLVRPYESADLTRLSSAELLALLRLEPSPEFVRGLLRAPPANALARAASTPFYAALRILCPRWCGEPADAASALTAGLTGLVEVECMKALWDLAQSARATPAVAAALAGDPESAMQAIGDVPEARPWLDGFQRFLDRFGHRAIEEVELARPRWREKPAYPLSVVASYLHCPPEASPYEVERRLRAQREALERRIRARLRWRPMRRLVFELVLGIAQKAGAAGENTKFEIIRVFWVMRMAALELGRRLANEGCIATADDVFFLELREIEAAAGTDLRPLVASRRADHRVWQREDAPRVIDDRGRPVREGLKPVRHAHADPRVLTGVGSSAGKARGRVRVVLDPASGTHMPPASILVAPYTDPAWTPLFVSASAVVVEIGSLLSHASIVAREMGIPSVVAVPGATSELREGELVEVDGSAGTIRRMPEG